MKCLLLLLLLSTPALAQNYSDLTGDLINSPSVNGTVTFTQPAGSNTILVWDGTTIEPVGMPPASAYDRATPICCRTDETGVVVCDASECGEPGANTEELESQ